MTRSERRHRTITKFKRRFINDFEKARGSSQSNLKKSRDQTWHETKTSRKSNWLRTTSTPCSCGMCSYLKYERNSQKKENHNMITDSI
jgi:hypothetical protein